MWYVKRTPFTRLLCVATVLSAACAPGALRETPLTPRPSEGASFFTLDEVVPFLEDLDPSKLNMAALRRTAVIGGRNEDSFGALLTLSEYPELLYLDVLFFNRSESEVRLSPELALLVDGARMQFRQVLPHEAANLLLAQQRRAPVYEPKTEYVVDTYRYGNYSQSRIREVPSGGFEGLGTIIAAFIIGSQNKKLTDAANLIYERGLLPGTTVATDAALRVGLTWLNRPNKSYPLEVRLPALGYRVRFDTER